MHRHVGGRRPGGEAPPSPTTYHDGAPRLGPQGLQHLPLHEEVGQEDDRRDLRDGGHGEGPLWGRHRRWPPTALPGAGAPALERPSQLPGERGAQARPLRRAVTAPRQPAPHHALHPANSRSQGGEPRSPRLPPCARRLELQVQKITHSTTEIGVRKDRKGKKKRAEEAPRPQRCSPRTRPPTEVAGTYPGVGSS